MSDKLVMESISEKDGGIRVFSSGSEYIFWGNNNCHNDCARLPKNFYDLQTDHPDNCLIEATLCFASIDTGCISPEIYKLMGKDSGKCTMFATEETIKQEKIKEYNKHQHDVFEDSQ